VPNFKYKDLTDPLIADTEAIARQLCEENEKANNDYSFTSVQFIRRVAKLNQGLYVQLLERSRQHSEEKWIINAAHEAIGNALYWRMYRLGWEQEVVPNGEIDIFHQPTDRKTYRPPREAS
jgi:hypothetical protein